MSSATTSLRIGIYGSDGNPGNERHGCGLWPAGHAASITYAGATPVPLTSSFSTKAALEQALDGLHGLVLAEIEGTARALLNGEKICLWCRDEELPLLAIDGGLHVMNSAFGGTTYNDLARELPEALQHRHPPERGLRHAITTVENTWLAELYGDGEVVVNSEHRRAVQKLARGFRIGARALDGVIEAIEAESESWFALGVQWQPASATASGLDIQLFRGLVDACQARAFELVPAA
jgi:gamma-glutamyl-gamma-aminobutyrate hydrolase PuuD